MILILTICSTIMITAEPSAYAVRASDWDAGRIIDDSIFTGQDSMTVGEIQSFLNQKVATNGGNGTPGVCDTNGIKISELGGGTRAQYGISRGNGGVFTCLKDYYEVPKTVPGPGIPANNYGGAAIPPGAKSAAQLIYDAAQAYRISPKVLLVTIQKESPGPLITDDWPLRSQYTYAMGARCPDSGPGGSANCDTNYAGFSIQILESAALFRYYLDNMTKPWWPYAKIGLNTIRFNPNSGCGASAVNIQSSATAALYTYTPYQPNQAALNNMYGTGDSCSAYGNRNFWRIYNDWFGSTSGDLVRTLGNATVYLISGDNKYPINDISVLSDFSALGPIRYVNDAYLNTKTTGPILGRMVGASNGTLYFVNAGIKLHFSSCDMVIDFGYTCSQVITLTDSQLSLLYSGPGMSKRYKTTSGKEFYIEGGLKREVFDQVSLTEAGITGGAVSLLESGISYLGYGTPVIRDRTVILSRFNNFHYFYENNKFNYLAPDLASLTAFSNLPRAYLDDGSIPFSQRNMNFSGLISNVGATLFYVLLPSGKVLLNTPNSWSSSYLRVSDVFLNGISTDSGSQLNNQLVKSTSNGTVYYVTGAKKRLIPGWGDLLGLNIQPFVINTIPDTTMKSLTSGGIILAPGSLIKTSSSSTVYIVKDFTTLFPITSFVYPSELGLSSVLRTVSDADFQGYNTAPNLYNKLKCGNNYYIGIAGVARNLPSGLLSAYGYNAGDFPDGSSLCANLRIGSQDLNRFIRVNNGTIYYVQSGQKYPFAGYGVYLSYGGSANNTLLVSDVFAQSLPTGSVLYQ